MEPVSTKTWSMIWQLLVLVLTLVPGWHRVTLV
jgi:hypothetical protein